MTEISRNNLLPYQILLCTSW